MTPEQKAIDILEKLIPHVYNEYDGSDGGKVYNAKRHTIQTALILVDEVLNTLNADTRIKHADLVQSWTEVKNELEKL
jgi:hypothetical protein